MMTNKPSYGFTLWAVPRFHRPAQTAPKPGANLTAASTSHLFAPARLPEAPATPGPAKNLGEASGRLLTYH